MMLKVAFEMMRLAVLQMPIRPTPGFLSSATNQHAIRAVMPLGSTYSKHSHFTTKERELHRLVEAFRKAVHIRLHLLASIPDGPAAHFLCREAVRIAFASMFSNINACVGGGLHDGLWFSHLGGRMFAL